MQENVPWGEILEAFYFSKSWWIYSRLLPTESEICITDQLGHRECVSTSAEGARTHRSLGHHLFTRWFWGFWYYVHPLVLRPRALFYTDCTRRFKFLTHALGHVETIFRSFSRFAYSIYLPNCIFFLKALGISAYVNTICKLNKSIARLCLENINILFYDVPIWTKE